MLEGNHVRDFERRFSQYIDVKHSISIPSARLGLYLIFKYYKVPENTEVIITPFTHWSIFTVIKAIGLKPIFCDIDENTHNIDPGSVRKLLSRRTKFLILTHMWGQPCDMDAFLELKKEHDLIIIEDCAMAAGAEYANRKVGSFGDASIFSFGKAKAINAFGGGMLCTNDGGIADFVRGVSLGFHHERRSALAVTIVNSVIANILTRPGVFFFTLYPVLKFLNIRDPYNPVEHKREVRGITDTIPQGWKVRFSNIQAAVGIEQLRNLDKSNEKRIKNARVLERMLSDIPQIKVPSSPAKAKHIYLYYAVYLKKRIDLGLLRKRLIRCRIDSQLNELTGPKELAVFGEDPENYPVFKNVSGNLLIIPNGIYLNEKDIFYIGLNFKRTVEKFL